MFCINKERELTPELLQKMIERFNLEVKPNLKKYKDYYDGIQEILNKSYSDSTKPCSKAVVNYCRNIADSYCGYLASPGYISYSSDNDIEEIMNVLRYNDYQSEDADFLLDALVYGTACELMYMDEASQVRFKLINPAQCFPVYDDTLLRELIYFIRIYKVDDWSDSNVYRIDVYSNTLISSYEMEGEDGTPKLIEAKPHYFSQCPANVFYLPDNKSIFDCVMDLQDAANEVLNSEIDDYSSFCDAYLTLVGMDADDDDIKSMKENRVLLLPEGASASWLIKQASDAQIENMLSRIQASIYRIAACPDFSSESFVGGVSSGIAIKYRLTGMETRAAKIVAKMKEALQRRVEIICGVASLKLGEEVFRDISIDFKRNIPEDNTSIINLVNALKGTVSDATLLAQLPFVEDVNAELEALQEQKQANMAMYSMGPFFGSNNEEDEEELAG